MFYFFFFSSRRRHTRCLSDWSSDVCSSDLTGLHQTPEMIAQAALQEDVNVVGLSILSGAHLTLFPRVKQLLVAAGRDDVLVTGGGIIPPEDIATLQQHGIGRLFGPGTPTADLVKYIEEWAAEHVEA